MIATPVIGSVIGVYAVIAGTIWFLRERRRIRREGQPARRLRVVVGVVGVVLGIVLLVLTVLLATGVVR